MAGEMYMNGLTYSAHPLTTAIALAALDVYEREGVVDNVRENEAYFSQRLNELRRVPIVGDVRGAGYFWSLELVKDRSTKLTFDADEADWLLRDVLSKQMVDLGLLCRLDDRGDPVVQLSPPLVADRRLLDELVGIVGVALEKASDALQSHAAAPAA
jgi:adenosylmethionine-8-amino-7-oxononanoate aminotransferase